MRKFILIIALLISGVGLNAQNVGDNTIIDYEGYSLQFTITSVEPAECEVKCSTKPTEPTAITIPYSAEISGIECSVTSIEAWFFHDCFYINSVEIPNSVTSIGPHAFSNCDNLTNIEIPNSVTSIEAQAFSGCSSLTSIVVAEGNTVYDSRENCNAIIETSSNTLIASCQNTIIPNSVTSIGSFAFSRCSSLTSIEIPNSVTSIGSHAFSNCDNLTNIEIPNSVTSIGWFAFERCSSLTSIEIPNSVTSIGRAFAGCSSLTSIVVAEGNTVYDSRENCNAIIETSSNTLIVGCQNTVIPNSVTSVGYDAFYYCDNLTNIEIPNSVTSIEGDAFFGCSSLTSVEIPNSVTSIGRAFAECSSLTSIVVAEGNTVYDSRENCNAIIETSSNTLIVGCQNTVIPNSVTSVGYDAFYYCESLTSIEIPNSVTYIGESAFFGCSSLTSIEIPNSVTSIGESAFGGCSNLTKITCHAKNVPETGNYAFDGCPYDMTIYVPVNSVALYEDASPWNEYNIEAKIVKIDYDGYSLNYTVTSIESAECEVSGYLGEPTAITIPSSIEIEGIEFSVTSIKGRPNYTEKGGAFENCLSLTSVEIPNSVTSIGHAAFSCCSSLINITFGDNSQLTSIGVHAFSSTAIASIEIPNSVTFIDEHVFNFCSDLESIVVEAGNTVYDSRNNCNAIIETSTNKLLYGCVNTVIPSDVTSIEDQAFVGKNNITTIIIPDNVISIGGQAFYECLNLESIVFEENSKLERFEDGNVWGCFYNCKELKSITIPKSVKYIGRDTFKASGLENIVFEEGSKLDTIGYEAFSDCSSLTSIEIPNTVNSIRVAAFSECSSLTSIVVAEGNTVYDSRENCNAIIETSSNKLIAGCQNTVIPNSVTSIGNSAFYYCSSLTSIEIPNSVTSIGSWAFSGCSSLTSIEIPNSVTSIGNGAFSWCSSLTSIICHAENVPETESSAFNDCPSDMIIYVPINSVALYQAAEPWNNYNIVAIPEIGNNSIIDYEGYSLQFTITSIEPAECEVKCSTRPTTETAITIPSSVEIGGMECSVTKVGNQAFFNCSNLTSIEIPNSVTSIGNEAFSYCYLTSIEIPNSVTSIGNRAFSNCSNLTSIEIPNSVTSIGNSAFSYCYSLTNIEIPNSVSSIGNSAFSKCSALETMSVEEGNSVYDSRENCNAIIETETNTLVSGCKSSIIPNSVTSIGNYAFYGCSELTSIEIPNSVTSIGNYAFSYCYLTSIEIPNSVTSIGNSAFSGCSALETMSVEEGNSVYDSRENCNAIIETETNTLVSGCKSSIIPNSVTSIGNYAFSGCSELTSIEIPNSVTSIGNSAFSHCSNLTSIEIPNSVTSIGNFAFSECTNLTSIEIPNSVTSIGIYAFSYCYRLTSIEIPNSVTSIGNYAFCYCERLTSIECHASEVPVTDSSAFYVCPSDMTIMVPSVALEDYQAAEPWNNYNLITGLEFEVDVLKNIEEAGTISGTGTYTDGETVTITAVPNEGYKFVYWSHNGTVLSADAEYSFTVTSGMVIEANFLTPNHWTPDPTIYPNNMTIIADVKIDGRDLLQRNIIFKLYDSYGDGWNGCSLTVEFSDGTPSQNLTFDSGSSAVHTLKVYSGTSIINVSFNQGLWPHECSFTIEYEDGELIYQSSGTPNAGHVCEFKTLGYSPLNIELGAFCGEELRGTSRSQYIESPVDGFEFFLLLYGNDSDEITFKLYDHETDSVLDLVTQERIDFEANSTIGIMSNPNIINFTSRVSVTTEAEIAEAGSVTGGGMYHIGETITLTATSNEGFVFKNWTLNDEVVSEESEYTFVVASEAEYKANYHYRQERQLTKGWNWYSTYVNNEGPEGLYAMEDELGSVGRQIKSQNDFVSYEDGSWYGTLSEVSNDEMYMIKLSRAKKFEMIGEKVDLSECPITLGTNWKWISYPLKRPMNVGMAFSGITPNTGDYIKSQTGFAQYDEELGWRGTLNSMMPGEGYMYYNTSGYAKTLVYPEANAKTEIEDNITSDYNHWIADMTMYPANMNIIATVDNNSDNNFEVAAFCDGECRGSARPIYIEELNANIIFLTVCGDNNETISFRYYDIDSEKEYDIVNTLTFSMNDITGSMREPYIMSFIPADVDEVSLSGINIYPNPADINDEINLGAECERVEIYNSLGVKVSEYENVNHIDGIETAGIYVIKIINKGTIKYDRIIVR